MVAPAMLGGSHSSKNIANQLLRVVALVSRIDY
jgi:hypothetical protein